MSQYKVIQDIEAEDKLLGPLTLKQFIFAGISAGFIFLAFMVATKISIYGVIPFLPFIFVSGILAAPLSKEQPTDVWLSAQIRFFTKPRKHIWDQNDIKQLVTITVPKKIEKHYSDGLSQQEVHSRLKALADTIDSRGWAVKNVDVNLYNNQAYAPHNSDRLVSTSSYPPQNVPDVYVNDAADIMDAVNNPLAQHFDEMVKKAERDQKTAAIDRMYNAMQDRDNPPSRPTTSAPQPAPVDYSFMNRPDSSVATDDSAMFSPAIISPSQATKQNDTFLQKGKHPEPSSADEQALLDQIKIQKQQLQAQADMTRPHHKVIKTPEELAAEAEKAAKQEAQKVTQAQAVTPPKNPGIVNLANTNDLSVASIAALANRKLKNNNTEGVIRLH